MDIMNIGKGNEEKSLKLKERGKSLRSDNGQLKRIDVFIMERSLLFEGFETY